MKSDNAEESTSLKYDNENGTLIITLQNIEGSRLADLQKAILLGIEEIGYCERSGDQDHRDAIWQLTYLLRALMLDDSQTNVGLGGKPYKKQSMN
jgi:hypothetical protein